jgi:hypothetical protein
MKAAILTALLVSLSAPLNAYGHALHFTQNSRRSTISIYPADLNGTLRTIGLYSATDSRNYQAKPLISLLLEAVPQASLLPSSLRVNKQLFNNDTYTASFIQQMRDNMTAVITNQGYTDNTLTLWA